MSKNSEYWPYKDPRYRQLGIDEAVIPASESLKDVTKRTSLFWDDKIVPLLRDGKQIMIVGHENNLRSIIKRLDNISDDDILHVELPRAIPLVYSLDRVTLKPIKLAEPEAYLSATYLCDKDQLKHITMRDQQQVYDTSVSESTIEKVGQPYHGFPPKISIKIDTLAKPNVWKIHDYLHSNHYNNYK